MLSSKFFIRVFLLIVAFFCVGCEQSTPKSPSVTIGEKTFQVEIADTPPEQRQGLMYRTKLDASAGMLFVFEEEKIYPFWMKNTPLPLDIIWINADKKIVDTVAAPPCYEDPCTSFIPEAKALYVLEVNQGQFEGEIGERVEINF